MPSVSGKEQYLLTRFLKAYDNGSWADAHPYWADEHEDGAVELIATRVTDALTLAIEHTLIQPNPEERHDFAKTRRAFPIDTPDPSLDPVEGFLYVNVPLGVLPKGTDWNAIAGDVLNCIRLNKDRVQEGSSELRCVSGGREIVLQVRLVKDAAAKPGQTRIRRYGPFDIQQTVQTALANKLPKLVRTIANRRLLMLERDQWQLDPKALADEISAARAAFPDLASVDEVWMAETHENQRFVFFVLLMPWHGYVPAFSFVGDVQGG